MPMVMFTSRLTIQAFTRSSSAFPLFSSSSRSIQTTAAVASRYGPMTRTAALAHRITTSSPRRSDMAWLSTSSTTASNGDGTTTTTTTPSATGGGGGGLGMYDKLAFIGTGKMAAAMVYPLIKQNIQPAEQITLYDVSPNAMKDLQQEFPTIQIAQSIDEVVTNADCVVLAVKPQNIGDKFWSQFPQTIREDCTMLSILAGTPISSLLDSRISKIVRSMPNTPSTIGSGMTVWTCTPNLTTQQRSKASKLLNTFGKAIYVDDEKFVDMSTSISGSGPAYIFLLMEAMIDAGVHMGFSRETATTLVHHTLLGSTLYAMETQQHPAILRNSVTSPAGTTASAIYALESGGFRTTIKDAIWACYRRSLEMGGKDPAVGPGRRSAHYDLDQFDSLQNNSSMPQQQVVHNHYNLPTGEMKWSADDVEELVEKITTTTIEQMESSSETTVTFDSSSSPSSSSTPSSSSSEQK